MIRNNIIINQTEEIQKKTRSVQIEIEQNNMMLKDQKMVIQKNSEKLKAIFYTKWPKLKILKK